MVGNERVGNGNQRLGFAYDIVLGGGNRQAYQPRLARRPVFDDFRAPIVEFPAALGNIPGKGQPLIDRPPRPGPDTRRENCGFVLL